MQNPNRFEAERLIGIAEKLLQSRDLNGAKEFAILAQETDPLIESSDQILAVADVILAADKNPNQPRWYDILQIDVSRGADGQDLHVIRTQYRRLALLLHPEKNLFPLSQHAFALVSDAWAVLSDPAQKHIYDLGLRVEEIVSGPVQQQEKLPVRRGSEPAPPGSGNFWTACPYCYWMYEYPRVYEGCCLMCQNCERSFHGVSIPAMPPLVPGEEAYYCSWGFFPMGFVFEGLGSDGKGASAAAPLSPVKVPDWVPVQSASPASAGVSNGVGSKKRGRPRKVV